MFIFFLCIRRKKVIFHTFEAILVYLEQCFSTGGPQHRSLLMGHQAFLYLLKIKISDTNFINIIEANLFSHKKHLETTKLVFEKSDVLKLIFIVAD